MRDGNDYPVCDCPGETRRRLQAAHRGNVYFSGPSLSDAKSSQSSAQTTGSTAGDTSPVSGNSSPLNNQGYQYTAGGNLNLTADPQIAAAAFQTVSDLVKQALTTTASTQTAVSDANAQNQNALNSVLATVLTKDQNTTANNSTAGASGTQNFVLWALGIAVAGVVAFLGLRKKTS